MRYQTTLAVLVAVISILFAFFQTAKEKELRMQIAAKEEEHRMQIAAKEEALASLRAKFENPDAWRDVARKAFADAEDWRRQMVDKVYANVTDEELDNAVRWKQYADPFSLERSCSSAGVLDDDASSIVASLLDGRKKWVTSTMGDSHQLRTYLATYAYHSSGLEGNTLTLPEALLVVEGRALFPDDLASPSTGPSITEVKNLQHTVMGLPLLRNSSGNQKESSASILSKEWLVDVNAFLIRDLDTPFGLRTRPVAVGHQKCVLPMPDEISALVDEYILWLNSEISLLRGHNEKKSADFLKQVVSLSCDAHTRFVHIHPFSDGNGRLARLISAVVLTEADLPPSIIDRNLRMEYMSAVSDATIRKNYNPLCSMHFKAVLFGLELALQNSKAVVADQKL